MDSVIVEVVRALVAVMSLGLGWKIFVRMAGDS